MYRWIYIAILYGFSFSSQAGAQAYQVNHSLDCSQKLDLDKSPVNTNQIMSTCLALAHYNRKNQK